MCDPILIKHSKGALGLRYLGLGPSFKPIQGVQKIQELLNSNTSWANRRSCRDLKKMISNSSIIVSAWKKNKIIGFGRATTDTIFRANLWDIVVDNKYRGQGIGEEIVNLIVNDDLLINVEKIYLMTTHCESFYLKMDFNKENKQTLMVLNR